MAGGAGERVCVCVCALTRCQVVAYGADLAFCVRLRLNCVGGWSVERDDFVVARKKKMGHLTEVSGLGALNERLL
jgi:hypothetical protein